MKLSYLLGACLIFLSCSAQKQAYQTGDLVQIQHGKDIFRIDSAEVRETGALSNWTSAFYHVTNLNNGKAFSLPHRSLVLFEKVKTQPVQPGGVLAKAK